MAQTYTIQPGDHASRLADQFGFADFQTIWSDPQNSGLRAKRADPHVLMPGDKLYIPDKQQKTVDRPTGKLHTFVVKRKQLLLKLTVLDFDDQPVAKNDCELEIDGKIFKLQTDAQGRIQQPISRSAVGGKLKIIDLDYEFPVKIGHLDPVEEDTGWRARLINLGYHLGAVDSPDDPQLKYALEEFQCDHKLKVTGELDSATRAKLKGMHGG
jgi:hypothetical protein